MKAFFSSLLCISLIVGAVWVAFNRQMLLDQITVWQFRPSGEIAKLATDARMTDYARFLFYAAEPRLDGTQQFNDACRRQEEGSAILGCYAGGKIVIYDVKDDRLDGVEEVTAAHEMLHVAYERLSSGERDRLTQELESVYEQKKDESLETRMDYYERTEPGQRANELHAILATEYLNLSPVLEDHYRKYFTDRAAVVRLHSQYSGRFSQIADTTTQLRQDLERISSEIAIESAQYEASLKNLNAQITQFNARAERGEFRSQGQFEAERSQLVAESERLTRQREAINTKVDEYERSRTKYNSLVDESNSMQQALDSSLAPAPSL